MARQGLAQRAGLWIRDRIRSRMQSWLKIGPVAVQSDWGGWWGKGDWDPNATAYADYLKTSVGVYACATYRSRALAGVPIRLYSSAPDGSISPVRDGVITDLLSRVNPHWTWERLVQMTELSLCLHGEAHWILNRGERGDGIPSEIWWVASDRMRPIIDPKQYIKGWAYEHHGIREGFTPGEVIWFRYPNPLDEFEGLSPLLAARQSIEGGIDAIKANRLIFKNGMNPGGIIAPADKDSYLSAEQRKELEEALALRLKGVDKAHRMMVLSAAVTLQTPQLSPKDAEFLGLLSWSLQDICRIYGVPPTKVQDFSRATYSNVEQADKAFYSDVLIPEARMVAAEINEQLLPLFNQSSRDRLFVEFDFSGVKSLQEDRAELTSQMVQLSAIGVPLNAMLKIWMPELLPAGGSYPWGDEPRGNVNLLTETSTPVSREENGSATSSLPGHLADEALFLLQSIREQMSYGSAQHSSEMQAFDDRTRPWERKFAELVDRQHMGLLSRLLGDGQSIELASIHTQAIDKDDPFDVDEVAELWAKEAAPLLGKVIRQAGDRGMKAAGAGISFDLSHPRAQAFLAARSQRFAVEVADTTWRALKSELKTGIEAGESIPELEERVRLTMGDRIISSAETIARTEVVGAYNGGTLEGFRQSGLVESKTWLAALDDRTRESHIELHGTVVRLDEDFESDGESAPAPGQFGSPEQDINCRCTIVPVLGAEQAIVPRNGKIAISI